MPENQHLILPDGIFKIIFENSPGSLLVQADAPRFTIIAASDGYLSTTSTNRQQIVGKGFFEVFPDDAENPDDVTTARKIFTKVAQTGQKIDVPCYRYDVYNAESKTYEKRFWSCSNIPFTCNDKVTYILNTVVDITAEVNARQEAIESEHRLRLAAEATGFATFDWNLNEEKRYCSPQIAELFGHPPATVLTSTDIFNMVHPDDRPVVIDAFNEAANTGVFGYELRVIWPDGSLHWVCIKGKQIADGPRNCTRVLGTILDITESKRDEIRKNDFIAMASHELKTPLTSIKSYIQILAKKLADSNDSFVSNALAKANIQVNKMTDLIHGFLDLSKLESGKLQFKPELFDINQLITEIITEFNQTSSNHNLTFTPQGNLSVNADREKIGQVITNLLSNAIKYSNKGTSVDIKTRLTDSGAKVSITDRGIGIKPRDQKKLFQRFYRVENEKIRNVSGFGIGLYLAAEIIQCHKGKIGVESVEGEGSTFYFTLPA
ncbi:PAS domain-containing sensor histidine kinase [Mucilaginibacter celer]|uniref:histidine kinase n=1 Tax=Mucilaginibacter celer TaxID=2305508 RepID=A0A494VY77_9SPHI|nr:PAS domain-containing sensor histidine kinase [Mucilaginibacter celer]AYL95952.1 PAS domain S-box protein [Mucilaginibacter celer]